jgi:hypothetical protein
VADGATIRAENALEQAIVAALGGDEKALLRALAGTEVFVPRHGDEVPVVELERVRYVTAFSSLARLAAFLPDGGDYVALQGRGLAEIVPAGCRVALNPGSDVGLPLSPEQVASLRDIPEDVDEADLLIGEPREEPEAVLESIRGFAETRPEVRAVYRGLLLRAGSPEPVVGFDLDPGTDAAALLDDAGRAARDGGVEQLALLSLADGGPVARFLLERTKPFYVRR